MGSHFKMFVSQTTPQTTANPIVINLPSTDLSHEKGKIRKSFPKRAMMLLSILQIICGCLAVLFQIIHIFTALVYRCHDFASIVAGINAVIGWGIWTGVFFATSGIVGLVGAFKPSRCILIAFLVMNIISSVFTIFLIVPESIGIASIDHNYRRYSYHETTSLAMYCMMLIIGLVQAIVAIIAAGYSCSAICCGQNLNHPGTVVYAPNPNTMTNSIFVEIPLNTPTVTENEKMDQEDCPPNYEQTCGTNYQKL